MEKFNETNPFLRSILKINKLLPNHTDSAQDHNYFKKKKSLNMNHHINRLKKKSHIIILINTEEVFENIHYALVMKSSQHTEYTEIS